MIQPATATLIPTSTDLAVSERETPATITFSELSRENALAERAERSFIDRIASMENAAVIFKRRTELIETCYQIAIRRTRPQDWVLFKMPDGSINAMITASGAELIAEVYGVQVENLRPVDVNGIFRPEKVDHEKTSAYTLRGYCDAFSQVNGRRVYNLEAARRSDEDFVGRSVDADEKLTHDKTKKAGALDSDLRNAVLTLIRTKAVLCGMTRVPSTDLEAAWKGTEKKVDSCRKGHGFGTSSDRTASTLAPEDVKAEIAKLKDEVLRCVGGDVSAAKKLVKEITSGPNFKGWDSLDQLSKDWQVTQAMENLKKHPVFGKGNGDGKAAQREPGAEG